MPLPRRRIILFDEYTFINRFKELHVKHPSTVLLVLSVSALLSFPSAQTTEFAGFARNTFKMRTDGDQLAEELYRNPDIALLGSYTFRESGWSVTAFGNVYKDWAEALVGPRYRVADWLFVGISGGVEFYQDASRDTHRDWWRGAVEANLTLKKYGWYNVYEYGSGGWTDDYWYSDMTYAITTHIEAEVKAYNRGHDYLLGAGGIFTIPGTIVALSPVLLYNFQEKRAVAETMIYFVFD